METNIDLLKKPALSLPKIRDKDYFPEFLKIILDEYLKLIDNFSGDEGEAIQKYKDKIEGFCNKIISAVNQYYAGFPTTAYNELSEGLSLVRGFIMIPDGRGKVIPGLQNLFRVRKGTNNSYSKSEMFHIPFEDREKKIKTQRYSIPGLPCLYLGDSIYVCWEELRRLDINEMQVSRFEMDRNEFKFLDLSDIPSSWVRKYNSYLENNFTDIVEEFLRYMALWPLMAACSIVTKNDEAIFKPEHIIPQLLLQWVTCNHNLDGIIYFSTRINQSDLFIGNTDNYVLPVKSVKQKGLCDELAKKFKLTESISWQILNISNPAEISKPFQQGDLPVNTLPRILTFDLIKGKRIVYIDTAFGKMEMELFKMKAEVL